MERQGGKIRGDASVRQGGNIRGEASERRGGKIRGYSTVRYEFRVIPARNKWKKRREKN